MNVNESHYSVPLFLHMKAKLVVALSDRALLPHNIPFFLAYIR